MDYERWLGWWQERAETYFTDKVWRFSRPDLIKRLNISPRTTVLELGYGYGRETEQFCRLSTRVCGLELSGATKDLALKEIGRRGHIGNLPQLGVYDGRRIHYPDGFFDVVYACFVLQHLSHQHALELIRESLRVVTLQGHVLFEFFGDPAFHSADGQDMFSGDPEQGGMFNNAYEPDEIQAAIEASGGVLDWLEPWPITAEWGNWWACFGR